MTEPEKRDIVEGARELLAKATPGPWAYMEDETFWGEIRSCGINDDDPTAFSLIAVTPEGDERDNDFRLIARAPELLRLLADECERLRNASRGCEHCTCACDNCAPCGSEEPL